MDTNTTSDNDDGTTDVSSQTHLVTPEHIIVRFRHSSNTLMLRSGGYVIDEYDVKVSTVTLSTSSLVFTRHSDVMSCSFSDNSWKRRKFEKVFWYRKMPSLWNIPDPSLSYFLIFHLLRLSPAQSSCSAAV